MAKTNGNSKATPKKSAAASKGAAALDSSKAGAGQNKKKQQSSDGGGFLSSIRPRPRPVFLCVFITYCVWLGVLYKPCSVKKKNKEDCGHPGILPQECVTYGCFLKGGSGPVKKSLKITQAEGETLGLSLSERTDGSLLVTSVSDGAVEKHNAKQPEASQDTIMPGDWVVKAGGSSKNLAKTLSKTTSRTVEIQIFRPTLPSFLSWLHSSTPDKPTLLEKVLSTSGTKHFGKVLAFHGQIALATWYISGYGLASAPMYIVLSSVLSWRMSMCCHDSQVGKGVPHCYMSQRISPLEMVSQAINQTMKLDFNGFVKKQLELVR